MELKVYIKKKLRDFDLKIDFTVRDEVFALLGASGCGKSMTLKCIAGIETPDEGEIILNGRVLYDSAKKINLPPQARRTGYLFQNYALFPNMTVAENILFAAVGTKEEKILKLKENLQRFHLNGLEDVYPHKLSGGQQQRVSIARVLSSHAEILLLDEPFSALDSYIKWQLEDEVADILKSYGIAILVTHDRDEVKRLTDKVGIMELGRIVEQNNTRALYQKPSSVMGMVLTGIRNISKVRKVRVGVVQAVDWGIEVKMGDKAEGVRYVGIRSEEIVESRKGAENSYLVEVVGIREDGLRKTIKVRTGGGKYLIWEVGREKEVRRGEEVIIGLPVENLVKVGGSDGTDNDNV